MVGTSNKWVPEKAIGILVVFRDDWVAIYNNSNMIWLPFFVVTISAVSLSWWSASWSWSSSPSSKFTFEKFDFIQPCFSVPLRSDRGQARWRTYGEIATREGFHFQQPGFPRREPWEMLNGNNMWVIITGWGPPVISLFINHYNHH